MKSAGDALLAGHPGRSNRVGPVAGEDVRRQHVGGTKAGERGMAGVEHHEVGLLADGQARNRAA